MSLRRTACRECRQAKRRCNTTFAQCDRCTARGLQCHYIDLTPLEEQLNVTMEDFPSSATLNIINTTLEDNIITSGNIILNNFEQQFQLHDAEPNRLSPLTFDSNNLSDDSTSLFHDTFLNSAPSIYSSERPKFLFCVQLLKQFPRIFAQEGHCGFIHRALYLNQMPTTIRHAYNACCAFTMINEDNKDIQLQNMNFEVEELLKQKLWSDLSVTLTENLAIVQALILYQILRLFNENAEQRHIAEQQDFYLDMWTQNLEFLSQLQDINMTGLTNLTWSQWILTETVHRTLLMSYLLRGIFWALRHSNIPFKSKITTMDVSVASHCLWESFSVSKDNQIVSSLTLENYLTLPRKVPYARFAEECKSLSMSGGLQLGLFETLLIVACKGREYIRSFSLLI
ncbi:hypothetical protein F5884DRAFT_891191 [Xylogone sp. PMI_703]|nr:hypothetical protein F5884DRAFT_891191 [Xylogone sp. PMI_703]